jgi:acetyl esterase/lipase
MRLYLPDEGDSFPVFVYFHGGGIVHGSEDIGPYWPTYLTEHGVAVVSANYRLYPDAKFPEFIQDAADAVSWVKNEMKAYCNVENIYVGGSSAGGYLSMMLCFDKQYLLNAGLQPMDVSGYVFDAGQPTTHFNVLKERGYGKDRQIIDDAAPIYHVGTEKEYPPMMILVADDDMKNRYEQTLLLIDTLRWNGHKNFEFHCLRASHCGYDNRMDENGESVFGGFILKLITETSGKEAEQ